jgi:hypothetical protein
MSESLEAINQLLDGCSEEDLRAVRSHLRKLSPHPLETEWGIDAETILTAISRSSDLTKRGMRGIIAEAVFVNEVVPAAGGWHAVEFMGNHPFDALLQKGELAARIQVKLQRTEEGVPKLYYPAHYDRGSLFVVEVQKTRTGEKIAMNKVPGTSATAPVTESVTVKTRPYSFGDFDILAVNMHPSTGNWKDFRYTVASWLLPRATNQSLIEVFQPVAATPNDVWTGSLLTCLGWFERHDERRVLTELLHRKRSKKG